VFAAEAEGVAMGAAARASDDAGEVSASDVSTGTCVVFVSAVSAGDVCTDAAFADVANPVVVNSVVVSPVVVEAASCEAAFEDDTIVEAVLDAKVLFAAAEELTFDTGPSKAKAYDVGMFC